MKYQDGDSVAVHPTPIWRERADCVFAAHQGAKDGRNDWEQLWGQEVAPQRLIVCCIPFFVYDIALGDEVEVDAHFVFQRIVNKSKQLTFRIWFGGQEAAMRQAAVNEIEALNPLVEWSSENLLALSVPEEQAQSLADLLAKFEKDGRLEYEAGQS